ncbi:MAG: type IV pilus assembly protein PilM [Peptococcaceae bacterium]|nr:type IV pilus assembly protein PilM [Peptococcaceae bacterium]
MREIIAKNLMWIVLAGGLLVISFVGLLLLLRGKRTLGIDVGNAQIKIVELRLGKKPHLLRYAIVPTPPSTIENAVVKNPAELKKALLTALKIGKFTVRRGTTVLTGQNLLLRHIELPPMPQKELRSAIAWQFDQFFQMRLAEMLTDYQVISEGLGKPSSVLLVAMQREPVMVLVDNLRQAGLLVEGVDIEPLAALRAIKLCRQADTERQTVAVVDCGAGTTNISIFSSGLLSSVRVLNIGGSDFTRAVMNYLGVDWSSAEAEKKMNGFRLDSDIATVVIPLRDKLFNEINKTLSYYFAENRGQDLVKVVIMGGGSSMVGLGSQLEKYLYEHQNSLAKHFSVELCNPLMVISHKLPSDKVELLGPTLSVAVGLAIREEHIQ